MSKNRDKQGADKTCGALHNLSRYWSEQDARAVLDAWEESGKSAVAFADEHGLKPKRLYWWRQRLRRPSSEPAFIPVVLCSQPSQGQRSPVVVTSSTGVRIEISELHHDCALWVAALLRALEEPAS